MRWKFLSLSLILGATALAASCSNGEIVTATSGTFGGGGNGAGHSSGSNTGAGGNNGAGGGFTTSSGAGAGSGAGGMDTCAATEIGATLVPVNLYIMLDKSGSMAQNNKWPSVTAALIAFFQDPASAGLRVALRFFPDAGCDGQTCDVQVCSVPAVDVGPLTAAGPPQDAQETNLVAAVQSRSPSGNTPMYAALYGAELWAQDYAIAHPGEKVAVLLATDGEPNGCDPDPNHIAQLAADARAAHDITTYAIGFQGSNQAQLDQIAQFGGTNMSFVIGNGNAEADLIAALKAIQGSQVACDFAMPTPDPGKTIDPTLVNVDYTPGGGGMKQTIGQVTNAGACGPKGGWYYDDANNPTKITLCPATCTVVQADSMPKIDIALGCATQPVN